MMPARLSRAWAWHLPGAGILAVERMATAAATAPAAEDGAATPGEPVDPALAALVTGVRQRRDAVRSALIAARAALQRGDRPTAARHVVQARELAAALADPTLDAWTDLFASVVALADGAAELGAMLSCRAEDNARRAADPATYLAVWWTRAARALRRGNGGDGVVMARWMRPWLTQVSPLLAGWLGCFEGAYHLDDGRRDAAIAACAPILADAPTTSAGWAAGRLVTCAFLALGRADDAARVAVATLDHAAAAPAAVRAQCYAACALAFEAAQLDDAAARSADVARALDPSARADPSAAELDGAAVELLLL